MDSSGEPLPVQVVQELSLSAMLLVMSAMRMQQVSVQRLDPKTGPKKVGGEGVWRDYVVALAWFVLWSQVLLFTWYSGYT